MAQLIPIPLSRPGMRGLNRQQKSGILSLEWATILNNAVFNSTGDLASREGYKYSHSSSLSEEVVQVHTYIDASGNELTIFSTPTKLYKEVSGTVTDITGTATTPTAGDWKFQNFNGKCVAWQTGHTPIVLSTTGGSFADMSATAGSLPSGNECLSAWGRMWVLDGNTLKWSDLLIETAWSGGSSGTADLSTYWPQMDEAIGLAEHNDFLFVFGKNNILILTSPESPSNLAIEDKIQKVGLIARDAKVPTSDDFAFASRLGVTSLGRVIQEKSMPVRAAVPQIRDDISSALLSATVSNIKMAFSQADNTIYLTTGSVMYVLNLNDEKFGARVSTWDFVPNVVHEHGGTVYYGVTNYLATKTGYNDGVASDGSGGSSYLMTYEGPWTDLAELDTQVSSRLKIPKRVVVRASGSSGKAFTFKWYLGFEDTPYSRSLTLTSSTQAEYGVAQYGVDEWAGALPVSSTKAGMSGNDRVIKVGVVVTVDGSEFALKSITPLVKIGREAF